MKPRASRPQDSRAYRDPQRNLAMVPRAVHGEAGEHCAMGSLEGVERPPLGAPDQLRFVAPHQANVPGVEVVLGSAEGKSEVPRRTKESRKIGGGGADLRGGLLVIQ